MRPHPALSLPARRSSAPSGRRSSCTTAPKGHAASELEHSCAGISPRTLSERLRALEDEEIVERRSYAESPPRVEYELTEKGAALLPIIEEMRRFGHAHLTE